MHIPESFSDRLHRDFHGRFRIRWSEKKSEFQIEQKLAPGQVIEPPKTMEGTWDTYDDEYLRARDGYWYVMSVRQGDRMRCDGCGMDIKIAVRETRESVCWYCKKSHRAAYYPLDDLLLLHLRWIDPHNGGVERAYKRMKDMNRKRELSNERDAFRDIDAATSENFNRLFDIQQVGYTGKERYQ